MDDIIIIMIIIQWFCIIIGYPFMAKSIENERRRIEALSILIFLLPILSYYMYWLNSGMKIEVMVGMFEFMFYSYIANIIGGTIIKFVEDIFLN